MTPDALTAQLLARIASDGPISIERWMGACLDAYYARGSGLGAEGDFVTAPECSQMFGELLGLWAAVVWQSMGAPVPVRLVEVGPGRGTLMADALRALAPVPAFREALSVHLVERSPAFRARQREALKDCGLSASWHDRIEDVPSGPMLLIANEFLDALPIRQYVRDAPAPGQDPARAPWRERLVAAAPGRMPGLEGEQPADGGQGAPFVFVLGPPLDTPPALLAPAHLQTPAGEVVEVCPAAHAVVSRVAARLVRHGGAALFIDYGPAESAAGDSLQAVRHHAAAPVLADPGGADLTAHVDFQALAATAAQAGARVEGLVQQGPFLLSLGLQARAQVLMDRATASQKREVAEAVRRLIDSAEMGTLFKVMGLCHPGMPRLPGF